MGLVAQWYVLNMFMASTAVSSIYAYQRDTIAFIEYCCGRISVDQGAGGSPNKHTPINST